MSKTAEPKDNGAEDLDYAALAEAVATTLEALTNLTNVGRTRVLHAVAITLGVEEGLRARLGVGS
jgi:adenylosuccinate lyase